jgi:hypothetical protein
MSKNEKNYTETDHPLRDIIRKILLHYCIRPIVLFKWLFLALLWAFCLLKLFGVLWALSAFVLELGIIYIIVFRE